MIISKHLLSSYRVQGMTTGVNHRPPHMELQQITTPQSTGKHVNMHVNTPGHEDLFPVSAGFSSCLLLTMAASFPLQKEVSKKKTRTERGMDRSKDRPQCRTCVADTPLI